MNYLSTSIFSRRSSKACSGVTTLRVKLIVLDTRLSGNWRREMIMIHKIEISGSMSM